MAETVALQKKRLRKELSLINKNKIPNIDCQPDPSNYLHWYYCIHGVKDSPYKFGLYLGKLIFPKEYPNKPPSILMLTPNGRFKINTRLCLSMSDFHPESWSCSWSVSTILIGLGSFFLETTPTLGSIETSNLTKKKFALQSPEWNKQNKKFKELFPHLMSYKIPQEYITEVENHSVISEYALTDTLHFTKKNISVVVLIIVILIAILCYV